MVKHKGDLLPCPFCGEEAELAEYKEKVSGSFSLILEFSISLSSRASNSAPSRGRETGIFPRAEDR